MGSDGSISPCEISAERTAKALAAALLWASLAQAQPLAGRPLQEVLREFQAQGLNIIFSSDLVASITPDVRRLRAFDKIELNPGEKRVLNFKYDTTFIHCQYLL